jgi:hypothetical protein
VCSLYIFLYAFSQPLGLKKRPTPRVAALVQLHPPKPPPRPPGGSHCLGYHLPGAGWWVTGATGRAKCQLRVLVLGSPSALHTKEPRTGGGGGGGGESADPM